MTLNVTSEQRLLQVHPVLANKIRELSDRITTYRLIVTQTLRSYAQQSALYLQGRDSLDKVNEARLNAGLSAIIAEENVRVTDADGGFSWHNFGMAVDVAPEDMTTNEVDWDDNHPIWQEIVEKGKSLGMTSGESWGDRPHFQMTGKWPVNEPTDEVRSVFSESGLNGVWSASGVS